MRTFCVIGCVAVLLCLSSSALEPGDRAPDLTATQWLNGGPVNPATADGTNTYVIEFWATWCGPCRRSIPHLNEIQKAYADRNVIVVGVTEETDGIVHAFLQKNKIDIEYRIAIDTNRANADTYMEGIMGIPHAFIVDKDGMVAWSGHPLSGLDEALKQVLDGTYDLEAAGKAMEAEAEMQKLLMDGEFDRALDKLEGLIAADRMNFEYHQLRLALLAQGDASDKVHQAYREMLDTFADSAESLNTLAWMAVTSPFEMCDLEVAWKAANRAVELSKRENAAILDTLARVHYALGRLEAAVQVQKDAVAGTEDPDERRGLETTLRYYEEAVRVGEDLPQAGKSHDDAPAAAHDDRGAGGE